MYNNPRRNDWEKSEEIIKHLNLKEGDRVIDIGCGFGFYSYRFSKIVGKPGKVWAVDISESYIEYMKEFVKKYKINNIVPVLSKVSNISVSEPSDVAFMCSIYHVIYGLLSETERIQFISSIKHSLKPGGLLVIADNSFDNGRELNSSYLNKELAIAQLIFYGFRFMKYVQITPQRYLLIFKHEPGQAPDLVSDKKGINNKTPYINITSGNSLIYFRHPEGHEVTEKDIEAAKLVYEALKNKNLNAAKKAISLYNNIIPIENFGGEYSTLLWFCEYLAAPEQIKAKMLENPHAKAYFNYLAKDDFKELNNYLDFKYNLTKDDIKISRIKFQFLEDFILFNNPKREELEKTSKIMDILNLKEGQTIGDIRSRSGYYTYKFSQIVGEHGKVYAIDVNEGHLNFIKNFIKEQKIKNVEAIKSTLDDISLKEKVDYLFMCSLYNIIYGIFSEASRANFIMSIKKALKKDGRLIIVDNEPVNESMPLYGSFIDKELIIAQLFYYGFTLEKYDQITPQRYMLTFKLN
ncbi:MAG: class I SAM-dependent methyltransferase, partial [Elusimicrobiota bacterium]